MKKNNVILSKIIDGLENVKQNTLSYREKFHILLN